MQTIRPANVSSHELPSFVPDYIAENIFDVNLRALTGLPLRGVLLDLDSTLRTLSEEVPSNDVIDHLKRAIYPFVEKVGIVTTNPRNLMTTAKRLDIDPELITQPFDENGKHISKPAVRMFDVALEKLGTEASSTVMIGDKLFSDITGANRAGIQTIWLAKPLGRDRVIDKLLMRPAEKIALKICQISTNSFN